jgi:integrase
MATRPRLRVVHNGKWRATNQKYLQWFEPTGAWRFRRAVPKHLRAIFGLTEWTKTLDARTENEAIRLMQPHIAETDRIVALADDGNWPPIPDEDVEHVAWAWWEGEHGAKTISSAEVPRSVERFMIGPRSLGILDTSPLFEWGRAQTVAILNDPVRNAAFRRNPDAMSRLIRECRRHRAHHAIHFGNTVDLQDVAAASAGIYAAAPLPVATPLNPPAPPVVFPLMSLGGEEAADKSDLLSKWAAECAPDAKWLYQTRLSMKKLVAVVGHDDATRITRGHVIEFKEKLAKKGLNSGTINRYLGEIKRPFEWAFKNEKIGTNPTEGVVFERKSRGKKTTRLGYTDEQARIILLSARDEELPHRRWIPWVCAFTGTRLDEIAGRDVRDIEKIGSYWVLNIPEGKTPGSVRKVPLHPVLINEGFIDYVEMLPTTDGPLFPDLTPDRFGRRAGSATKRIGRWLRQVQEESGVLLVDTKRYVPNHSWRHRFKSEARRVRIEEEVHDALTGHREGKISRDYGEYYVATVLGPAIDSMLSPLADG